MNAHVNGRPGQLPAVDDEGIDLIGRPGQLPAVDDEGIDLVRACGMRTLSLPAIGVRMGWLVPRSDVAVFGGLR